MRDTARAALRDAEALMRSGRPGEALARLRASPPAAAFPSGPWHLLAGRALQHLDRHFEALQSYERALDADPALGLAWTLRGQLLRRSGRMADAATCFRHAIACGEDAEELRYFLSAVGVGAVPAASPPSYIRALFDDYAEGFSEHLVGTLRYRGHLVLTEPLPALQPGGFRSALDLGCGSGLCAPPLRAASARLAGVDLSPRMLDVARRGGLYDELHEAALADHLRATPARHDLVVCADVLTYVGDLVPVLDGLRRCVAAGGLVALSVETCEADAGYDLLPTLRYAHAEPYLRALADEHGFDVARAGRGDLREGVDGPIEGLFLHLRRRGD